METNSIIIITAAIAIITAILLGFLNKDIKVTIKMEEENDYPIKSDGVEELEIKPKRRYKKRTPKATVVKRAVGRPRKVN